MPRTMVRSILSSLLAASCLGCAAAPPRVASVRFEGWDAVELRSSSVRVVVVPAIGRIVHFGRIDGPNLLWLSRKFAEGQPAEIRQWQNFGGDKVWPWPQSQWASLFGRGWPPPPGFDPGRFVVEPSPDGRLRLVSDADPASGYRVVREIELASERPSMRVLSRIERVARSGEEAPILAAWTVTQLMPPDELFAPVETSATRPWVSMSEAPDARFVVAVPGGFRIEPLQQSQKAGFDASVLVARFGEDRLVQRIVRGSEGAYLDPTDRAQVYAQQFDQSGRPQFVELEFTAAPSETSELVVEWTIEPVE